MKIQLIVVVLSFIYLSDSAPVDNNETKDKITETTYNSEYGTEGI